MAISSRLRWWLPLLGSLAILAPTGSAWAAAADEELAWYPPEDSLVGGFVLYLGTQPGQYSESYDLGWVAPDGEGVARYALGELPTSLTQGDVYVAMTAYYTDDQGGIALESSHSNELFYPVGIVSGSDGTTDGGTTDGGTTDGGTTDGGTTDGGTTDGGTTDGGATDGGTTDGGGTDGGTTDGGTTDEAPPMPEDFDWSEDFEGYLAGDDPSSWVDTYGSTDPRDDDRLFATGLDADGNMALTTDASDAAIHSHFAASGSEWWNGYELSGRLATSDDGARVGVTLLSALPDAPGFYALEHRPGEGFAVSRDDGTALACRGRLPKARRDRWYRFRFDSHPTADGLELRAKVWQEGTSEPRTWMQHCLDGSGVPLPSGRVGVIAEGPGVKRWDDLRAFALDATGAPALECGDTQPCAEGFYCSAGVCTELAEAPPESLYHADFETAALGELPSGWEAPAGSGIGVFQEPGSVNRALGSHTEEPDERAHLAVIGSETWSGIEWSGRLLQSHPRGGVGVTVHADPLAGSHYALRSDGSGPFRLVSRRGAVSSAETCLGSLESPVQGEAGQWLRFRLRTRETASGVRVRARVWPETAEEPAGWPIDCTDATATALRAGTVGIVADGKGRKYWDDLTVTPTP